MSRPILDPEKIWVVCARVTGNRAEMARALGVPDDEAFAHMLRSMVAGGWFATDGAGFVVKNRLPAGLTPESVLAASNVVPPAGPGNAAVRPAPAGVVPFTADTEPAAAARTPPPGTVVGPSGVLRVQDDRLDRIAKADILDALGPLVDKAASLRDQYDNDWGDKDADDMLAELLDAVEAASRAAGYGVVGNVDDTVPYDPDKHIYACTVPSTGMTAEVVLTTTGQTWVHRGVTHILTKAFVELVDDERGQFVLQKVGDLDCEDDPEVFLWADNNSAYKPGNFVPDQYLEDGGNWYRVRAAAQARSIFDDCGASTCDHPKGGDGTCGVMVLQIDDADDYLFIPYEEIIVTQPAE